MVFTLRGDLVGVGWLDPAAQVQARIGRSAPPRGVSSHGAQAVARYARAA